LARNAWISGLTAEICPLRFAFKVGLEIGGQSYGGGFTGVKA
jgi:hypothetical protein